MVIPLTLLRKVRLWRWKSAGQQGQEPGPEPEQAAAPLPFSSKEVEECDHGHAHPTSRRKLVSYGRRKGAEVIAPTHP